MFYLFYHSAAYITNRWSELRVTDVVLQFRFKTLAATIHFGVYIAFGEVC